MTFRLSYRAAAAKELACREACSTDDNPAYARAANNSEAIRRFSDESARAQLDHRSVG
jgi:hypothetical protein